MLLVAFIANEEISVVTLVVASGLIGSFMGFIVHKIMQFNYFSHLNVIFVLFTFHIRRLITFLQGSRMIGKMSEIIKSNDGHTQRNVE